MEKKSRIRMNGEEHLRTLSSFISTGNTEEEDIFFHGSIALVSLHFSVRAIGPTQRHLPDNEQHSQKRDIHARGRILF